VALSKLLAEKSAAAGNARAELAAYRSSPWWRRLGSSRLGWLAPLAQFADATLGFLRQNVPRNWATMCDSVTDNFRVIRPSDFRVMT